MTSPSLEAESGGNAPLEKVALETYLPPAKPSLVGLSRAEIAEHLAAIGVARRNGRCASSSYGTGSMYAAQAGSRR